jgi:hypothetical protein
MRLVPLCVLSAVLLSPVWSAQLSNQNITVTMDPAQNYAISQIVHRGSGFNFAAGAADKLNRSPWRLQLRRPDGTPLTLSAADATTARETGGGQQFSVTWTGVGSKTIGADLTVTVTAALRGEATAWRISVTGKAPGALWEVDFPRLALRPVGEDFLAVPHYLGRLKHDPVKQPIRFTGIYPSPMSMQFMATWGTPEAREPQVPQAQESGWGMDRSDATGLLWAASDRDFHYKLLCYDTASTPGVLQAWIGHIPPVAQWPLPKKSSFDVNYSTPYDVLLQPFTGDAYKAASIYRSLNLAGPSQKPAKTTDAAYSTPEWFRNVGFWAKYYQEPAKIVPEWAAYAKWLQVPISSHYYRGTIAVFDDNYPEMLPVDPYYISGIRDAKDMGVHPMPYTNGVIWDRDTQSYIKDGGAAASIKDEAGNIPTWDISREYYSYMCPATKKWQDTVGETAYKQAVEHGTTGVYLDCLTATQSYLCYDPTHGHTLRGGNYYAQGQRQMMYKMRSKIRKVAPGASFFPEMCGEWLIDLMDGYLNLDISRSAPPPGEQVFPLFNLVYHQDTINFGDDAAPQYDPARHAWEMGHTLIWGMQPLYGAMVATPPKPGDPNSEMLRDLVQAYYVAGRPFLCGGTAVPMVVEPTGTPAAKSQAAITLGSAPYQFTYELRKGIPRLWQGPAVIASAWRRGDHVGVVMCNISDQPQQVSLKVRPEALKLSAGAKLVRRWPLKDYPTAAAGAHTLTVPARRVAFYVITDDPAQIPQGGKLLDTSWEFLTADGKLFEALQAKAGSLWACSDGPVQNTLTAAATAALPMALDAEGKLSVREGVRPKLREGEALPRETDNKSFVLLRPLPVTAQGQGEVVVLSGDADHLLCTAPGGVKLTFARPGLLVATDATGKVIRAVGSGSATSVTLPAGGPFHVGYAVVPSSAALKALLQTADEDSRRQAEALSTTVAALTAKPTEALLAQASRQLSDLERGLGELPGAFIPGTALDQVHRQIQALVAGQLATTAQVQTPHDWLAPNLPLRGSFALTGAAKPKLPLQGALIGSFTKAALTFSANGSQPATWRAQMDDLDYVMRLVPLVIGAQVQQGGQTYAMADFTLLDCNRPFELQTQALPATAVSGKRTTADVVLRNWSPYDLQMWLKAEAPERWQVSVAGQAASEPIVVPALKNVTLKLQIAVPDTARGVGTVKVRAGYTSRPDEEGALGEIVVNVQPRLVPLQAAAEQWAKPAPEEDARIRQSGKLVFYGTNNQPISLTLNNLRVTQYTNSVAYRLLDPELNVLKQGKIAVDKSETLSVQAPSEGAYFLEVEPVSGSVTVLTDLRPFAEVATKSDPLRIFTCPLTRYFYVPAGAKEFRLGAQDGGPDEGARFVITSPTGRVGLERSGNYSGAEYPIEVKPEEAGKVWALRVEPLQDISFWLAGDVMPYLSTAPERLIVEGTAK